MNLIKILLTVYATYWCCHHSDASNAGAAVTNGPFINGSQVGLIYRDVPINNYNVRRILFGNVDSSDGIDVNNPNTGLTSDYEKYMCLSDTRAIMGTNGYYFYIHEANGANKCFLNVVLAATNGLDQNCNLIQRLLSTWSLVEKQKAKYFTNLDTLFIRSDHIADLFRNVGKVIDGIAIYKDRTTGSFPQHVGFFDFDNNWQPICDKTFKMTPQGLVPVPPVPNIQIVADFLNKTYLREACSLL